MKTGLRRAVLLAWCVFAAPFLIACSENGGSEPVSGTSYAMNTFILQSVYGDKAVAESAYVAVSDAIAGLENQISWHKEGTDISLLNQSRGEPVTIGTRTAEILRLSFDVARASDGAFDPTIQPVSSLWDFGGENQRLPSDAEIQAALSRVNYENLLVTPPGDDMPVEASLKDGAAIDLGSVGKGAACDDAVKEYGRLRVDGAVVAVGGSIGLYGKKPDGKPWVLAVRDPASTDDKSAAMGQLTLESGYISTSGSYERWFEKDGKIYHHLLNANTGYPEDNDLVSVTVVAPSGALSDALSTACFLLGREKALPLLEKYGAQAVFIGKDNAVSVTDGLKDSFQIESKTYHMAKE